MAPDRDVLSDRSASPLGSLHEDSAEIRRLGAEVERLHKAWQLQQNLLVQDAKDCEALRSENERLMDLFHQLGGLGGPLYMLEPNQGEQSDPVAASIELRRILTEAHKSRGASDEEGRSDG